MPEKFEMPVNSFPGAQSTTPPTRATAANYQPIREGAPIVRHSAFADELVIVVEHALKQAAVSESQYKNFYALRQIRDFVKFSTHQLM